MWRKNCVGFVVLAYLLGLSCTLAFAEDAYLIGCSMPVTGPGSDTYAPIKDALDIYFKEVNAKGGINGHPVRIIIEDNSSEPSKAAAHAKKLVYQDKVILLMNAGLSSTFAPMMQVSRDAKVPLFFGGAVCPPEVYPPNPDPNFFCSTWFGAKFDSRFALSFIKEQAKDPVKLGLVAMNIPLSRVEIDYAEELSKSMGMEPVDKEVIPPPAADYTPYATKIKNAGANWVYTWAPWVTEVRTFEALRKLGWKGKYMASAHVEAEQEILRLKDEDFYVTGGQAYFVDNTETHKKIKALAEKNKTVYPYTHLAEGWITAVTLEEILKKTSWPPTPEKVISAMNGIQMDLKDLRGGKLIWTKDNHYRTTNYYKVYRWDSKKNGIAVAKDWTPMIIK
jgi:branched-chain amino acid transport system substrate-binding protein